MMAHGSLHHCKPREMQPVCSPSRSMSSDVWTLTSHLSGRVIFTENARTPAPLRLPRITQSGGHHMHPYRHFRHPLSPNWMPPSRLQSLLSHSQPCANARHDASTWWSRYHDRPLFICGQPALVPIPSCFMQWMPLFLFPCPGKMPHPKWSFPAI